MCIEPLKALRYPSEIYSVLEKKNGKKDSCIKLKLFILPFYGFKAVQTKRQNRIALRTATQNGRKGEYNKTKQNEKC